VRRSSTGIPFLLSNSFLACRENSFSFALDQQRQEVFRRLFCDSHGFYGIDFMEHARGLNWARCCFKLCATEGAYISTFSACQMRLQFNSYACRSSLTRRGTAGHGAEPQCRLCKDAKKFSTIEHTADFASASGDRSAPSKIAYRGRLFFRGRRSRLGSACTV